MQPVHDFYIHGSPCMSLPNHSSRCKRFSIHQYLFHPDLGYQLTSQEKKSQTKERFSYFGNKVTWDFSELEPSNDKAKGTVSPETKASITPVPVDGRIVKVIFICQPSALVTLSIKMINKVGKKVIIVILITKIVIINCYNLTNIQRNFVKYKKL